ncbi:MAG: hypothetical protein WCA79_02875 [Anaerolineales bacterium]
MAYKKKNSSSIDKPSAKRPKPAKHNKEKASRVEQTTESDTTDAGFTRSLGGDRSLQAYKDWIKGMVSSITPNAEDHMTEEEWVESWKKFWSNADHPPEPKPIKAMGPLEAYPGIEEQLRRFQEAELPSCPSCGSSDTANVQVGVIGRTVYLAGATKKFKLVPNMKDRLGKFFCNNCGKYFD